MSSDPVHEPSLSSDGLWIVFRLIAGQLDDTGAITSLLHGLSISCRQISDQWSTLSYALVLSSLRFALVNSAGRLGRWRRHIPDPFAEHIVVVRLGKNHGWPTDFLSNAVFACLL